MLRKIFFYLWVSVLNISSILNMVNSIKVQCNTTIELSREEQSEWNFSEIHFYYLKLLLQIFYFIILNIEKTYPFIKFFHNRDQI